MNIESMINHTFLEYCRVITVTCKTGQKFHFYVYSILW